MWNYYTSLIKFVLRKWIRRSECSADWGIYGFIYTRNLTLFFLFLTLQLHELCDSIEYKFPTPEMMDVLDSIVPWAESSRTFQFFFSNVTIHPRIQPLILQVSVDLHCWSVVSIAEISRQRCHLESWCWQKCDFKKCGTIEPAGRLSLRDDSGIEANTGIILETPLTTLGSALTLHLLLLCYATPSKRGAT